MTSKELKINLKWKGKGINEKAYDQNGNCIIEINKRYFRPLEVDNLRGDYRKARKVLKWKPKKDIRILIKEMVKHELDPHD